MSKSRIYEMLFCSLGLGQKLGVVPKIRNDESGQVLVFTALSMTILLGFTALATDVGVLFYAKRKLQIAADAAASAGAVDYLYNGSATSAIAAAKAAATQNGVTGGSSGANVTINVPPSIGPNAGYTGFVEAIVSTPNPTFFMKVFNRSSVTVAARAVAGDPPSTACVWLMATSGTALTLKGSYDIEAAGCGMYVNSPSSNAINVTGNGGTVKAGYVDVVGSATGNHVISPTTATTNADPMTNPYGNLTGPDPSNGGCTSTDSTSTTVTGNITGPGLGNAMCYTKAVTLNNVTFGAGTYVFENGVTIPTGSTVTLNGGTFDLYNGTYNQASNSTLSLTAPTTGSVSGTFNSIAFMVPANNASYTCGNNTQLPLVFGSSSAKLDGVIYAPCAQLNLNDSGGNIAAAGIVAYSLYNNSALLSLPNYNQVHASTTPLRAISLVE
jgi:Flp pilus assembly protein TadG